MKKSIIILLTLGLIIASGTAYAAVVDLQGILSVNPSQQSTFFFNAVISDPGSLSNWQSWGLGLVLQGGPGAIFSNFRIVTSNPDYVFFTDSSGYNSQILVDVVATADDATASGTGVAADVGDLLASITVDVSNAQAGQTYTIFAGGAFFDDENNRELITQLQPDYSFQVVPIPAAAWLLGGGLIGLLGLRRRFKR
jgi:hypothetical protein